MRENVDIFLALVMVQNLGMSRYAVAADDTVFCQRYGKLMRFRLSVVPDSWTWHAYVGAAPEGQYTVVFGNAVS